MRVLKGLVAVGLLANLLSLVVAPSAHSFIKSELVELEILDTTLTIKGFASPDALVVFREGGSAIGSVTASSDGSFTALLTSQQQGLRTITASFTDVKNKQSKSTTKQVSVQPQTNTDLDLFLSPTITRQTAVSSQQGSIVQINGYSVPGSKILLAYGSINRTETVTAGADGFYEFLIDTSDLTTGQYSVSVTSSKNGDQSSKSASVSFTLVPEDAPSNPDIVVSPNQLPPPLPQTPDDGSVIDGDSVLVTGESVPNAQIIIYENGISRGSIFSDSNGQWFFLYQAKASGPVTLTFEACRGGVCSVLSQSLSLTFNLPATENTVCAQGGNLFELADYRFWGDEVANSRVRLDVLLSSGDGVLFVDWGDGGSEERFDHDASRPTPYKHSYNRGQYNGVARFVQRDCERVRYFSVDVMPEEHKQFNYSLMLLLVLIILPFSYYTYNRGKELGPEDQ